jgi:hypothetical protein
LVDQRCPADEEAKMTRRRSYPSKPGAQPSRFVLLSSQHQIETVYRLADSAMSDDAISQVIGWPVADVRKVVAERAVENKKREGTP